MKHPANTMKKGERTRKSIVAAAAPIFNQRGYEGSSISDLMEATGLGKGGIYRHFSSKEELAADAFDYTWNAVWTARIMHVDPEARGIAKVKQLIANFVKYRSPVAGGCPILNTAIEADDGNLDVLRARAMGALKLWGDWLRDSVNEGIDRGEVRRGVDPDTVATIVIAMLEGALMMSRLQRKQLPLKRAEEHLNRYLDSEAGVNSL